MPSFWWNAWTKRLLNPALESDFSLRVLNRQGAKIAKKDFSAFLASCMLKKTRVSNVVQSASQLVSSGSEKRVAKRSAADRLRPGAYDAVAKPDRRRSGPVNPNSRQSRPPSKR